MIHVLGVSPAAVFCASKYTASDTVAGTGVETAFASTLVIPGGETTLNTEWDLFLAGNYGTHSSAGTLRLRLKASGTTFSDSTALTMTNSVTAGSAWEATVRVKFTAVGASAAARSAARWDLTRTAVAANNPVYFTTATIDTSVAVTLSATVLWGTSNGSNTITLDFMRAIRYRSP